jgi:hypothetical protein
MQLKLTQEDIEMYRVILERDLDRPVHTDEVISLLTKLRQAYHDLANGNYPNSKN